MSYRRPGVCVLLPSLAMTLELKKKVILCVLHAPSDVAHGAPPLQTGPKYDSCLPAALTKIKGERTSRFVFDEEPLANKRRYPCSNKLSHDESWHVVDSDACKRCRETARYGHGRVCERC